MCAVDPISLGLAMATGGASFLGEQQQFRQDMAVKTANDENAAKATRDRFDAINTRIFQERARSSAEAQEGQRQALRARGTERAAQAEAGVTGFSPDAVLADLYREEGEFRSGLQTSLDFQIDSLNAEGTAATAQGQSQINAVPTPARPSFLAAGIRVLGQSLDPQL